MAGSDQPPPETDAIERFMNMTLTVEVAGWRDIRGNDFELDADGNLTSKPLDVKKLVGNVADRFFIDDPEQPR